MELNKIQTTYLQIFIYTFHPITFSPALEKVVLDFPKVSTNQYDRTTITLINIINPIKISNCGRFKINEE